LGKQHIKENNLVMPEEEGGKEIRKQKFEGYLGPNRGKARGNQKEGEGNVVGRIIKQGKGGGKFSLYVGVSQEAGELGGKAKWRGSHVRIIVIGQWEINPSWKKGEGGVGRGEGKPYWNLKNTKTNKANHQKHTQPLQ